MYIVINRIIAFIIFCILFIWRKIIMRKRYISILILAPIFTYLVLYIIRKLISTYSLNQFILGSSDAWVSFFGSITASLITVIILIDTIKRDNIIELKEEARNNQPFIYISPSFNVQNEIPELYEVFYQTAADADGNELDLFHIPLRIRNLSTNPAKDVKLISQKTKIFSSTSNKWVLLDPTKEKDSKLYQLYTTLIDENKFIPGKEEDIYRFRLSINDYDSFIERDSDEFKYSLTISYRDLLDIAEYEQEYIIKLRLSRAKDYSPLLYGQPTSTKVNKIKYLKETN